MVFSWPNIHCMLNGFRRVWDVQGQARRQAWWTTIQVDTVVLVEVDNDDGKIQPNGMVDFPWNELAKELRVFANEKDEELRVLKPDCQLFFDGFFLARIVGLIQIMRIVKVEIDTVVLLPRFHQAVIMYVMVPIKSDVCFVSVWHFVSPDYCTPQERY